MRQKIRIIAGLVLAGSLFIAGNLKDSSYISQNNQKTQSVVQLLG